MYEKIFKIREGEIPNKIIKSISFPDLNLEQRNEYYCEDVIPVTLEFLDGSTKKILTGKVLIVNHSKTLDSNESDLASQGNIIADKRDSDESPNKS